MRTLTLTQELKDWKPNITDLSERLIMGPQREVLHKVAEINNRFGLSLKVTKTYRWSPGYMDQVKDWAINRYLQIDKKRPISTFFNQIDEKQWQYTHLRDKLNSLEGCMKQMRGSYNSFQDNSDVVRDAINGLIEKITNQSTMAGKVDCFIGTYYESDSFNDDKELFVIRISLPETETHLIAGNSTHPIPINEAYIYWAISIDELLYKICSDPQWLNDNMRPILNRNARYSNITGTYSNGFENQWKGRYYRHYINDVEDQWGSYQLSHPYISNEDYSRSIYGVEELDSVVDRVAYVCLGSFQLAIEDSLYKLQFDELYSIFMRWHTTYNATSTSPMNRFNTLWYGKPKFVTDELAKIFPSEMHNCRIRRNSSSGPTTYCDEYECAYRLDCRYYNSDGGELSNQDGEAEDSLSADFEVVDSDADNIHGGEYAQTHTAGRDDIDRFDPEAIVEEVNRVNRENGLTDDGEREEEAAANYAEEMDRINNLPIEDVPVPELTLEEQVIQWAAQQGGALNIIERNNHE